ncbi:MAG TPA: phosphomannomutase CpsG [Candidatus Polarisedimenticolaceae bacterium]|nr:phosphomannomutase CpsG [Candidatus Polarisedimenticolaceae bacterium]
MPAERPLACFKAYDIRGRVPDELNREFAYRLGLAFARFLQPRTAVVGHDIRLTSPELAAAVAEGLRDSGVQVTDIGLCGTEMVYFATFHLARDGGVMVTASHNPADYNGMKLVREGARPISSDNGLEEIRRLMLEEDLAARAPRGALEPCDVQADYVRHLLGYVERGELRPLRLAVNAGNGGAGRIIDALEPHVPFKFVKLQHEPDGRFPHGVPNPLLPDRRQVTAEAVRAARADAGIAWDGDFDRCFLFDEQGEFIEGYYVVGLLAERILGRHPGGKVVHDPRLTWNTLEIVERAGGRAIQSKSGHAFIKETMRREDAVYGGEMSAHHYFREFSYCDSGMIPWLLVAEQLCRGGRRLSELVRERMERFPASGEINRRLDDPQAALARVRARYAPEALAIDELDGVSLEFERWRFNLRLSNTEPLIRLNVESRGDRALMERKTQEVLELLG